MPTRLPWWLEGLLLINYTAIRQKITILSLRLSKRHVKNDKLNVCAAIDKE